MQRAATAVLAAGGLAQYEVSNYAASRAVRSRHNAAYWLGRDYLGVGPGAHGRYTRASDGARVHVIQRPAPGAWLAAVRSQGNAAATTTVLPLPVQREELLATALRTSDGLPAARWAELGAGPDLWAFLRARPAYQCGVYVFVLGVRCCFQSFAQVVARRRVFGG